MDRTTQYIKMVCLLSLCVFLGLGCPPQNNEQSASTTGKTIQIKGSDTEVNLVQRLAESFRAQHSQISIAVTGGGSGTGIAALINGQTHIANSSRPIKEQELAQAKSKGIDAVGVIFAVDGLAIIVHPSLAVTSLTLEQLGNIFKGTLVNWKELGGPDLPISLYGRQSNSGTYIYFRDTVLKADYSSKMRTMNGTSQIVAAVKEDKAGIGYVGAGYIVNEKGEPLAGIQVVKLSKDKDSQPISPLDFHSINSGLYPLTRPLYQYVNGIPQGEILQFMQFELSEAGQKIIQKEGFYPITAEHKEMAKKLGILK